jgi:hypothetical protein
MLKTEMYLSIFTGRNPSNQETRNSGREIFS